MKRRRQRPPKLVQEANALPARVVRLVEARDHVARILRARGGDAGERLAAQLSAAGGSADDVEVDHKALDALSELAAAIGGECGKAIQVARATLLGSSLAAQNAARAAAKVAARKGGNPPPG